MAEAKEKVNNDYNEINQMVHLHNFTEKWAYKACKEKFFKREFLASQKKINKTMNQCVKPQKT